MEIVLQNKKAVIFDMDGVIVDSESLWKRAEHEIFTSLGVCVTEEGALQTRAMTTREVALYWYKQFPWEGVSPEQAELLVVNKVIGLIRQEECGIAGIKEFIERLKAKGFKIGLSTNSPQQIIPVVLDKLGIGHLFDAVLSAEAVQQGKPHPAVYIATAEKLNVATSECVAVEDSGSGMMAAMRAGMAVVAFANGKPGLQFEHADYVLPFFYTT